MQNLYQYLDFIMRESARRFSICDDNNNNNNNSMNINSYFSFQDIYTPSQRRISNNVTVMPEFHAKKAPTYQHLQNQHGTSCK